MTSGVVRGAAIAALALLAAPSAEAEPRTYTLDPEASSVRIHVGRAGLLSFAGHEHEVVAPLAGGRIVADPERLEASSVELSFDAAALKVEDPDGPAGDIPEVQAKMESPDVLDVESHPRIRFTSREVTGGPSGDGGDLWRLRVVGDLELHGVTREVALRGSVRLAEHALTVAGELELKQSEWGIDPVSVAGVVKVRDELLIRFSLVARAAP